MKTEEIKQLLQLYFDGRSSLDDERKLETYFTSGKVADSLQEYAEFFGGISEIAGTINDPAIEDDVMDYILENEHLEKTKFRTMWKIVTGVAASVIIVLGGFLFYQQQQKPYEDTFDDPEKAYEYAVQTLEYVSGKYNKGLANLSNFETINKAAEPLSKSVKPINKFYEGLEELNEKNNGNE